MTQPEKVGVITGFEKESGELERVQVNMDDVYGICFVRKGNFVEGLEDMYEGDSVYDCGREMLTVNPDCDRCETKRFLLDDDTLHCPICS